MGKDDEQVMGRREGGRLRPGSSQTQRSTNAAKVGCQQRQVGKDDEQVMERREGGRLRPGSSQAQRVLTQPK